MSVTNIQPAAWHAIRAASMRATQGTYAARQYAKKHCGMALYRLACQLAAASSI